MTHTGTLTVSSGESRLDDGTILARCDETSPLGAATSFLLNRGFKTGDRIQVTGTDGTIGGVAVFCMGSAEPAAATAMLELAPSAEAKAIRAASEASRVQIATKAKRKAKPRGRPTNKVARKSRKGKGTKRP
jgi:hypothetical protein